ncbi:unnamed protein product [Citrullus colocynthis]|uniref:Uncharacterized protein n=1 Tax=Citrullus colocynthis TaxID=252529 RepID=A0ABP0Z874_9ROSI
MQVIPSSVREATTQNTPPTTTSDGFFGFLIYPPTPSPPFPLAFSPTAEKDPNLSSDPSGHHSSSSTSAAPTPSPPTRCKTTLRHFLGLLIQSTLSFYIFLHALQPTAMNLVAIPVFIAGIIKNNEQCGGCEGGGDDLKWGISHHKNKALNHSISLLQDTKLLSNYLTYLLAYRQSLFSNGMGRTRFEATVSDTKDFLRRHVPRLLGRVEHAYEYILEDLELRVGCRKDVKRIGSWELQRLEENERWEMMSHEWVELLAKVACERKFYDHIEQLGHGGDLLMFGF